MLFCYAFVSVFLLSDCRLHMERTLFATAYRAGTWKSTSLWGCSSASVLNEMKAELGVRVRRTGRHKELLSWRRMKGRSRVAMPGRCLQGQDRCRNMVWMERRMLLLHSFEKAA